MADDSATKEFKILPVFADTIRQRMASFSFEFDDYKIKQHSLNEFSIQTFPDLDDKNALITHLNEIFSAQNYDIPNWHWQSFEKRELGAKSRRIQSMIEVPELTQFKEAAPDTLFSLAKN